MAASRRIGAKALIAALVALLVAAGALVSSPGQAHATGATIGERTGFAPTSWMLLWGSDANFARDLDSVAASGAKWLRVDFDWASAEPSKGSFNWSRIDRVVAGATARGLQVLATPAYTPAWARPSGTTDKTAPTNLADYVNFVRAAATRYAPKGVHSWEIWNEPNIIQFWQPKPDPVKYTSMLKQSYAAIKAVDPSATVMNGGFAPAGDSSDGSYISPRTFISRMYQNGVKGSFDALAMHPYAYPYGIYAVGDWNQWQSMPKTYQLLVDNGDGAKKIWATEYGVPTGTHSTAVSESTQSQFVKDAFSSWTSWTWTGPLFWYSLRDSGTNLGDREQNFGLIRNDFSVKQGYPTFTSQMGLTDPNPLGSTAPTASSDSTSSTTTSSTTSTTIAPLSAPALSGSRLPRLRIKTSWSAAGSQTASYVLQRSVDGSNFFDRATLDSATTNFVDTGLASQTTYFYRVMAVTAAGSTPWSNVVWVRTKNK